MKICPYCFSKVELKSSVLIYGRNYGRVWVCSNYPECDAYVGCHKGTTKALGTLANAELRELRVKCHAKFDYLWKKGYYKRNQAYKELAKIMNLKRKDTHIGCFNEMQCRQMLEIVDFLIKEKNRG